MAQIKTNTVRTWVFYFVVNRGYDLQVLGTLDCKQPNRTNIHKQLQKKWREENVTAVGYTTELSNPFLVWP